MSKKHKKVCRVSIYIDNSLVAISTIVGCVSISAFAPFAGIPIGISSSTIVLKTCVKLQELKSISQ